MIKEVAKDLLNFAFRDQKYWEEKHHLTYGTLLRIDRKRQNIRDPAEELEILCSRTDRTFVAGGGS